MLLPVVIVYTINSCSPDNTESQDVKASSLEVRNHTYIPSELETLALINEYRISIGLNALEKNNYLSYIAEEHNNYMIASNGPSHNNFVARSQNIINVLRASKVSENIAYDYKSPKGAFNAWMNNATHKAIIKGDYTHFGISIRENPINGKKYYTNIFVKI